MIHSTASKRTGRPPADWSGRIDKILPMLDVPRNRGYIAIVMGWSGTMTAVTLKKARERGLVDFTGKGATARWHRLVDPVGGVIV